MAIFGKGSKEEDKKGGILGSQVDLASDLIFQGIDLKGGEAAFINALAINIYKRILSESLSVISVDSSVYKKIIASSANDLTNGTDGFIDILAHVLAKRENKEVYYLPDDKKTYFKLVQPLGEVQYNVIRFDATNNLESGLIYQACSMIYNVYNSAALGINASKSILLKIDKMSELLRDKAVQKGIEIQIKAASEAIKNGNVAYLSAGSSLEFVHFDSAPSESALSFCFNLISMATGYPLEFFNGVGGSSLSDTGASTEKAIRRANITHAIALLIPFVNEVFKVNAGIVEEVANISDIAQVIALIETTDILSTNDIKKLLGMIRMEGNEAAFIKKEPELPEFDENNEENEEV